MNVSNTPADKPPPVDASQLWTRPVDYSAESAAKAAAFSDEARRYAAGVEFAKEDDRAFYEKQADNARYMAKQQEGTAQYQKQQYDGALYATQQHNDPIEAALRAQEEAAARARAEALARMAVTAAVVGVVAETAAQPGGITGAFSRMAMGEGAYATAPTMMAMGPTAMFGRVGATAATLGIVSSLDKLLGPAEPAAATPAAPSATSAAVLDTPDPITVAANRPQSVPYNQAMHLDARPTPPRPNSKWFESPGGSSSGTPSA